MRLEGELTESGRLEIKLDQPTVLQTFLTPTDQYEEEIIADADTRTGFLVGHLRSGRRELGAVVSMQDRFAGYRTLITGASGYGKSTLIRNISRRWLEDTSYGKLIDDLKCEYWGRMAIVDTKPFKLRVILHRIFVERPQVTGIPAWPGGAACYRRSRYIL